MKTVFITIGDGEVAKNILHTDIFTLLKERVRLVLLVDPRSLEHYQSVVGSERVIVEAMPRSPSPALEEFFADLFLYSLHTPSIIVKIDYSRASGGSWVGMMIKRVFWFFGQFAWYRRLWRFIYSLLPDHTLDTLFTKYSPSLVFAANLTSSEDTRLLRAAHRRGLPSVGIPKGWDNLTLKTFLPVFPDVLCVQTPLMQGNATLLDYPERRIRIVGFPKFDIYANKIKLLSRADFMRSIGFSPERKLILYGGAGGQLAPHDEAVLAGFLDAITEKKVIGTPCVLVRAHPKYRAAADDVTPRDFWKLDMPGKTLQGGFDFSEDDVVHLMNSLYHCDLLVHTASTLGIEAAIFDKPSITIGYDADVEVPPALSVARYYNYVHMKRVLDTGGMKRADTLEELIKYTNLYLQNPGLDGVARATMAHQNAGEVGHAGARVAEEVLKLLT